MQWLNGETVRKQWLTGREKNREKGKYKKLDILRIKKAF